MFTWTFFVCLQTVCLLSQDTGLGPSVQVSEKVIQLLASENDPKCYSRTGFDFTCFWEASIGQSYYFSYVDDWTQAKCNLTQQTTAHGTVLHICSFPPEHVYQYVSINLTVVDAHTNQRVFQRETSVEKTRLLDPPKNISVERTGEPEQLLVRWNLQKYEDYEIRYFSKTQPEMIKEIDKDRPSKSTHAVLSSLLSGEVYAVQVRVRPRGKGIWSDWTEPVMAMVPQQAEYSGLLCYTSDLHSIQCQWARQAQTNGSGHEAEEDIALYRRKTSNAWGNWTVCAEEDGRPLHCTFHGEQWEAMQVSLHVGSGPLSPVFYTREFTINNTIKTEPPRALRGELDGERLHLQWDAPSEVLAQHLIYEIRYRSKKDNAWKHFTLKSPKTSTYLNEQAGSQYLIQIKTKPDDSFYEGYWSEWSSVLTVDVPFNYGLVFIACIPLAILLLSAVVASVLSRYFSKLKRYLWPPVPKLDKMLESFLAEGPHWEPTFNIKQCHEDTPASVVEILSDNPATSDSIQVYTCADADSHSVDAKKEDSGVIMEGCLEAGRDYVTLTTEVIPCLRGNEYVYGDITSANLAEMQCHCTNTQTRAFPVSALTTTSILNHSYQLLPVREDSWESESSGRYTNLEAPVSSTA